MSKIKEEKSYKRCKKDTDAEIYEKIQHQRQPVRDIRA